MTARKCAWPGCKVAPRAGKLMCGPDWKRLPKRLRDAILLHYRPGQNAATCTPAYRDALHEVLVFARAAIAEDAAAAEREADLWRRQGALF
jgi:hypothetical protein